MWALYNDGSYGKAVTEMLLQLSDNTQQLKVPTEQKLQEKCCPAIQLNSLTFRQHTVSGPHMSCVKVVSIQWQSSFVFLEKQSQQSWQTLSWHFTITPMLCNKATMSNVHKWTRWCVCVENKQRRHILSPVVYCIPCTASIPTKSSNWSLTLKARFPISSYKNPKHRMFHWVCCRKPLEGAPFLRLLQNM